MTDFSDSPTLGAQQNYFPVLHAMRIKGFATADHIGDITGIAEAAVRSELEGMAVAGAVSFRSPPGMWQLLPAGRALHEVELVRDRNVIGDVALALLTAGYETQFLPLNAQFKQLCTDWQMRNGAPNLHDDHSYDDAILARLSRLHDEAASVIEALACHLARIGRYSVRLSSAFTRLQAGEQRAFAGVMCASYHDVWMELHQELMLTLGVDRQREGSF